MAKIGFIGMGNMGYAMLKGALAAFSPSDIIFSSPDREKCERISSETGVRFAESNAECGNNAKYIVLAVKPQMYPTVLKNIVNVVTEESVIISIAPGITIASIKNALGSNIRVVRAMPNTPALIGEGMTGVAYNASDYSFDERDVIDKFFTSFGKVVYVDEKLMDGVVCASGSSPAYVYMFIEALADSVVKYGIKRDHAYKLQPSASGFRSNDPPFPVLSEPEHQVRYVRRTPGLFFLYKAPLEPGSIPAQVLQLWKHA